MSYYSDWVHANCDPDDDDRVWCDLCHEEMDTAWDEAQQDHIYVCSNEACKSYNPKYFFDWYAAQTSEEFHTLEHPQPKDIYDEYTMPPTLINSDTYPDLVNRWDVPQVGGRQ